MKLIDLNPQMVTPHLIVFLCPHCREVLLSVKDIVMSQSEQMDAFDTKLGTPWPMPVVGCKPEMAWSISGNFETMTVLPSLDASASGHWHGFIRNGEIV